MKKSWMIFTAIAVAAVIAIGVYFFVAPESHDYVGSSSNADCSMNISNDSFTLNYTEYSDNSYLSVSYIYSGKVNTSKFTVNSFTTQYREFGRIYKETSETGISVPLSDMIFFRQVSGGYLVKETFVKNTSYGIGTELLYVTTEEALDGAGSDITLLKGSRTSAIESMTVVEIYSDGTTVRYPVDKNRIGYVNLDTLGNKTISIGYGDGRQAFLTVNVVPFTVEKNEIMERGTSFEYAQRTGKIILDKADDIDVIKADGWDSSDGSRRIWLICGDYSTSLMTVFTSDSDRTVKEGSVSMGHYIRTGTDLPAFTIRMELNNGKVYDIQSDDPQLTLSGYDKNVIGPQAVSASYLGSQFSFVLYMYDDSNLIPKEAHLINVNKRYDSNDSLLLYTDKGLNYANYAIRYVMCDGTVRTTPLTEDMVSFNGSIDPKERTTTSAVISDVIETYRYSEYVIVMYDTTEEDIKASLTFGSIIGDNTSANYRMETANGTYNTSFGYRMMTEFYVAHDVVTASSYLSSNVRYTDADTESFILYLSKGHSLDMDRSILYSSELVRYEIDHDDMKYALFRACMTADDIDFFSGFGFKVGDIVEFTVTYDGQSGITEAMDISKDGSILAVGSFSYGQGVSLSADIETYVNNIDVVSVMMTFDDGREEHSYHVNSGITDLSFVCDEGYGVYLKEGNKFVPFEMPVIGITTSVRTYYLGSEHA